MKEAAFSDSIAHALMPLVGDVADGMQHQEASMPSQADGGANAAPSGDTISGADSRNYIPVEEPILGHQDDGTKVKWKN